MFTSIEQLNQGNPWLPECENERAKQLEKNKLLFEGNHSIVYKEQFKRVARAIGNFEQIISYENIINFQKKISIKTADLLLGELPVITSGDKNSPEQVAIDTIIENTDLWNTLYQSILDISRFGDGVLTVYKDGDKAQIDVVPTQYWYPVVDPYNIKKVTNHVLAWTYFSSRKTMWGTEPIEYLKLQIHYKGYYEERVHELKKGIISTQVGSTITVRTGLDDFAIITASNITTSDRVFGISDYEDVDSIVSEILVRISQINKILDKHADPSIQVPSCVLDQDPYTGEYRLKMGNGFVVDSKDNPEVKYITYDGQLEANFKMIDLLLNQLYIMSELGSLFLGGDTSKLNNISGSALRKMAMNALAKINRLQMRITPAIKKALKLASQLNGVNLSNSVINIAYGDGLPNDEKELSEIVSSRTGGKATMSVVSAIKYLNNCDDEAAQAEFEKIIEEDEDMDTTPKF